MIQIGKAPWCGREWTAQPPGTTVITFYKSTRLRRDVSPEHTQPCPASLTGASPVGLNYQRGERCILSLTVGPLRSLSPTRKAKGTSKKKKRSNESRHGTYLYSKVALRTRVPTPQNS